MGTIAGPFKLADRSAIASACGSVFQAGSNAQTGEDSTFAYAANLSHRLPLMYCVVLFDMLVLIASFNATAPAILTIWLPLPFLAILIIRAAYWLPAKVKQRSVGVLKRDIARLPFLGTVIALAPMCWSLALYGYGNQAQQSLVHYITAVTCFTGILGLGQAPQTALRMAAAAMIPSSIFFLIHDHPGRFEIVAVQIVVTVLVLLITAGYHADFLSLELSRQELSRRERDSAKSAEANRQNAMRDVLTGANNRRAILAILEDKLSGSIGCLPWLALIDLDGFKYINDTYGHAAGDAVLCAVNNRISGVPEIDSFGRIGGDEFAIVIAGEQSHSQVIASLDRLSSAISQPIEVHDLKLSVRGSIGLHRCSAGGVEQALERADTALYKAKENRAGGVAEFTAEDEIAMCERRDATRVFNSADLGRQLGLLYQPIVDSDSGRPVAFEALVRWSPDGIKWLSPAAFINLAETTGRIGELTRHVLIKALDECRAWQWDCSLAINLSAHDILRDDAACWIGGIVAAAEAPPSGIILEVTETALISDYRRAADNLEKLRQMGFRIALDDFGTGQSSLSHVHNLPLDHIKIDQSFARDLEHSDGTKAIVSTILSLARQLRLECTIEGVETLGQQVIARQLGIRTMQGYYFGRPVKAAEVIGGLDVNRSASAA